MPVPDTVPAELASEAWVQELFYPHRWGRDPDAAWREYEHLLPRWRHAAPLGAADGTVVVQIVALEACNWALAESVEALCAAIGSHTPAGRGIGHMASMTPERWRRIWAIHAAARDWLPVAKVRSGLPFLLGLVDPDGDVQRHVHALLGERTPLKEAYVVRFAAALEFFLMGFPEENAPQRQGLDAALAALDAEIARLDPDRRVVPARALRDGIELCHHKLFRRYDIILSSIGAERWRGAMPARGSDGLERAEEVEALVTPIEGWLVGQAPVTTEWAQLANLLGARDDVKAFQAALLVSLLRCQGLRAERIARRHAGDE